MLKTVKVCPAGAPGKGMKYHVQMFFLFFCDFLRSSGEHFWEYRHRFCVKRRIPVGIDFLGELQDQKFSPPKPPNMNF